MDYLVKIELRRGYYEHKFGSLALHPYVLPVVASDETEAIVKAHYLAMGMGLGQVVVRKVEPVDFCWSDERPGDQPWYKAKIGVFDLETTGLDVEKECPVEVGVLEYDLSTKSFINPRTWLVCPDVPMGAKAQEVHGIGEELWGAAPKLSEIGQEIADHLESFDVLIAHNDGYDVPLIRHSLARNGVHVRMPPTWCSMLLAINEIENGRLRRGKAKLEILSKDLGLELPEAHRAEHDARAAGNLFMHLARKSPDLQRGVTLNQACAHMLSLRMPSEKFCNLDLASQWKKECL